MAMISKYNNKCPWCNTRIVKGVDWIENRNGKWGHVKCPANGYGALGSSVKGHRYGVNEPLPIETNPIVDTDALSSFIDSMPDEVQTVEKVFTPSHYQQAIFDFISNGTGHAVVEAVAGSGKTTTIVQALKLTPFDASVAFVAFNKHIAKELEKRSPSHVRVSTLHKLGLDNIRKHNPKVKIDSKGEKMDEILNKIYPVSRQAVNDGLITKAEKRENYLKRGSMRKLVSISKSTLVDVLDANAILQVIDRYNVEIDEAYTDEIIEKLPSVMNKCMTDEIVDFDDMIWLPIVMNMSLDKFQWMFVDEWQDMNIGNIEFLMRSLADDGRMIVVGDKNQSLYAFRGATPEAMDIAINRLHATILPLSVTYRCPTSHVKLAQSLVPQIEARDNAPDGEVIEMDYDLLVNALKPKDMVICRTNAPLVKPAFECVRQGKKAVIRSDIERQLLDLIGRFDTDNLSVFQTNLTEYVEIEYQRKMDLGKEMQAELLQDRFDTLMFIVDAGGRVKAVSELINKVKSIFSDDVDGIIFSSVHKAKGLEAERVFILRPDLMPHKKAKKPHEIEQEYNAKYVAITRSKNDLIFVNGGDKQ